MINVLIADDHGIVREGVKHILAEIPEMRNVVEAANGSEVIDHVTREAYDVLILDISMPGMDGIDVLKRVRKLRPEVAVLVFSMFSEEQYAIRALKAGASGYLTKNRAPEELTGALRRVASGGRYVTPSLAEKLAANLQVDAQRAWHERLADREFQVVKMLAGGLRVSDIAEQIHLSVKTVSTYRARALEKLGLKNNSELMHYAIRNGLLT